MPLCCSLWNCRWLTEDRTQDLRRPDRSGYVIDVMPDFVTVRNDLTGDFMHIPVLQVWVDPLRKDDWETDEALFAYVERLGREEKMAALIRFGEEKATFIAPPAVNPEGKWFRHDSSVGGPTHTATDFIKAGLEMKFVVEAPVI
jgi:hypothetical protein